MSRDFEALRRGFDESPYASFLGMKLLDLSCGYAKVSMEVGPRYHNWGNAPHGGLIVSLADQAFGCAVNTMEGYYVAVQLSINFLGVPKKEVDTLISEAKVVHPGRSVNVAEITVQDSSGRVIARAVGTALAKDG